MEFPHSPQTRTLFKFPSRIACPTYRKMRSLVRLMWNWCTSYKTANWKTSCGLPSLCTVCEEEDLHIQSGCPKVKCKKRPFWTFENKKFSCFIIWSCTFIDICWSSTFIDLSQMRFKVRIFEVTLWKQKETMDETLLCHEGRSCMKWTTTNLFQLFYF